MFSEGDIKKLKRAIEGVEDKSFCPSCQMILSFDVENLVECNCCSFKAPIKVYDGIVLSQCSQNLHVDKLSKKESSDDNLGQEVEHVCSHCGHLFAWLKTMQLRSADEGQTCFYTCQKCKKTDREDG